MSTIKLLSLALRNPQKMKTLLESLKGARIYTNVVIAKALKATLNEYDIKNKAITISDYMTKNNYKNKELLLELLQILEEEGYVKFIEDKIWVVKQITDQELDNEMKKVSQVILDSFETFSEYTQKAFVERLQGIPPEDFDSNELRVLWNVALRGDFYSLQREEAINFAKLGKFARNQKEKPFRILDFGCGSGEGTIQLMRYLKNQNVEFSIEACDVSKGLLEIAADDEGLEAPIYFFNLQEKKPRTNYYDAIFISQVLHWPADPVKLIGELKSYLKPTGMLFGVQSIFSKKIYQIDLFIRLLGAQGFPSEKRLYEWFETNEMVLKYDNAVYSFTAFPKSAFAYLTGWISD